jgi:hypothetical protein
MEADRARVHARMGCRSRAPLALIKHRGLVALLDVAIARFTKIMGGLWLPLVPPESLELQPLHRPAMRAGHKKAPLVARFELALDARDAMNRRCRGQKYLAPQ